MAFGQCKHEVRSNLRKHRAFKFRMLGVNDANPTIQVGEHGATITRTGEGAYLITFDDTPGPFAGFYAGFQAATPADLKGYSCVADTYDTATNTLPFVIYNASVTAADLIANQYAWITVEFGAT